MQLWCGDGCGVGRPSQEHCRAPVLHPALLTSLSCPRPWRASSACGRSARARRYSCHAWVLASRTSARKCSEAGGAQAVPSKSGAHPPPALARACTHPSVSFCCMSRSPLPSAPPRFCTMHLFHLTHIVLPVLMALHAAPRSVLPLLLAHLPCCPTNASPYQYSDAARTNAWSPCVGVWPRAPLGRFACWCRHRRLCCGRARRPSLLFGSALSPLHLRHRLAASQRLHAVVRRSEAHLRTVARRRPARNSVWPLTRMLGVGAAGEKCSTRGVTS